MGRTVGLQSKTLDEAVINYRRRYNRAPPKGFDKWWEYAMKNDVKMVDEYDQIVRESCFSIGVYQATTNAKSLFSTVCRPGTLPCITSCYTPRFTIAMGENRRYLRYRMSLPLFYPWKSNKIRIHTILLTQKPRLLSRSNDLRG